MMHGPPVPSKMAHQPPRQPPHLEPRHLPRQHQPYSGHNGRFLSKW